MADKKNVGDDVASKVLRRLEVSKMTKTLQNRLALANVKIKHGWENLSLDIIEPHIDEQLKRKRPASSADSSMSETSSNVSSRFQSLNGFASSPITAPMFSDDASFPGSGSNYSNKRPRIAHPSQYPASSTQGGRKTRSAAAVQSWKKDHSLPESSPVYHTRHSHFRKPIHVSKLSFISESNTIPDEPESPEQSEEDDDDLPVMSFNLGAFDNRPRGSTMMHSSPPRTPEPLCHAVDRTAQISWSHTPRTRNDAADLLMYLATSPKADTATATVKPRIAPPSTPPSRTTPLPSTMMSTPGGGNSLFGFGFNTPSQNFNFSDFCNVTPSPAQRSWPKTPGTAARTPITAREARRKLTFDSIAATNSSPEMVLGNGGRNTGINMELGGALL